MNTKTNDNQNGHAGDNPPIPLATIIKVYMGFGFAATITSVCMLIFAHPYSLVWLAALLLPIVGLYLLKLFKERVAIKAVMRMSAPMLVLPCIAIAVRAAKNYSLYSYNKAWPFVIVITVVLTTAAYIAAFKGDLKDNNKKYIILLLVLSFAVYGYGLIVFVNCNFDKSQPQVFTAPLIRKYISSGKQTTYHFVTSKWGNNAKSTDVTVPKLLYQTTAPGGDVTIHLQQGSLGIPWYFVGQKQ